MLPVENEKETKRPPQFCRDKGRGRVEEGALCLSSSDSRHRARHHKIPTEASCHQDKHKAPAHPRIRPLSLQDGETVPYAIPPFGCHKSSGGEAFTTGVQEFGSGVRCVHLILFRVGSGAQYVRLTLFRVG